jgi:hypothetical protein
MTRYEEELMDMPLAGVKAILSPKAERDEGSPRSKAERDEEVMSCRLHLRM